MATQSAPRDTPRGTPQYDDEAKVIGLVKRCLHDTRMNTARRDRDKQDLLNLLMFRGGPDNQWVVWDSSANTYVRRPYEGDAGLPEWFPRTTTNYFANKIDGVTSILDQSQPAKEWKPETDDDQDVAAAQVVQDAMPVLYDKIGYEGVRARVNKLVTLTDKVAVIVTYDNDEKYGTRPIQLLQCTNPACAALYTPMDLEDGRRPDDAHEADEGDGDGNENADGADAEDDVRASHSAGDAGDTPEDLTADSETGDNDQGVSSADTAPPQGDGDDDEDLGGLAGRAPGACPNCGAPTDWAINPLTGLPLGVDYPIGKMCAEVISSFELSLPRSAKVIDERQVPWIMVHTRYATEDAIAAWPKLKSYIQPGSSQGVARMQEQTYADQMRHVSSPRQSEVSHLAGQSTADGPVIWRVWHDPIDDGEYCFPDGLYAALYEEDTLLEAKPLPVRDSHERPLKNVVLRTYAHSPGSAWGKPPADDLVPLQVQTNLCMALAFLILMHNAAPRTFIPSTVTLLDELTGTPGANVTYTSLQPGDKPTTEPGTGFPAALQWFIEFLKQAYEDLSGMNSVLQGAQPEGDPTLGQIQIMQERGLAFFKAPLDHLVDYEKRLDRVLLHTARTSMWAPRFRIVHGSNGDWDVKQFSAADLDGCVDVTCEPSSAWPRSPLLQNLRVEKALEHQILNPMDPEVQDEYLSLNDLLPFKQSLDNDRKQVARELDKWRAAVSPQQIPPVNPLWNLPIHLVLKSDFLKTEEAERLEQANPPVYQAMVAQVQSIQQQIAQAQQQAQATGGKGKGGGQQGPNIGFSFKGVDLSDPVVRQAFIQALGEEGIHVQDVAPAPSGPGPLDKALAAGALKPKGPLPPKHDPLHRALATGVVRPAPPVPAGAEEHGAPGVAPV